MVLNKELLKLLEIFCEGNSDSTIKFFFEEYKKGRYVLKSNNNGTITELNYFSNDEQLIDFLVLHY